MPRTNNPPKFRIHKTSGRALVVFPGAPPVYLGYGDNEATRAAYTRAIAEWEAAGRRPPARVVRTNGPAPAGLTVVELIDAYLSWAETYYVRRGELTSEISIVHAAMRPLNQLYGDTEAAAFGPKALRAVRGALMDTQTRAKLLEQEQAEARKAGRLPRVRRADLARTTVNKLVSRIRRVFRWGVSQELVPPSVWHGLQAVPDLPKGRCEAREAAPVRPVTREQIDAVLPYLSAELVAMIELQWLTGMRPGEVRIMRPCDIDRSGKLWEYKPSEFKTEHHGLARVIPLGPKAQAIIEQFWKASQDAYLFDTAAAGLERSRLRRINRKSPMTPSQERRGRRLQIRPGCYDHASYTRAIARACDLAWPAPGELERQRTKGKRPRWESMPAWRARLGADGWAELQRWRREHRWTPNQIRHAAATRVRREMGLEAAQVHLGHAKADVTQIYAEANLELAREIALKVG